MARKWWSILILGVCAFLCLGYGQFARLAIDASHFPVRADGDSIDHGQSQISLSLGEQGVMAQWQFGPGFSFPYVGVNWMLEDHEGNCLNLSSVDHIQLQFAQTEVQSFSIYLSEFLPEWSKANKWESYRPRSVRVWSADAQKEELKIPLGHFAVPDWWYVDQSEAPHQVGENLSAICRMGLSFGGKDGEKGQILIKSLVLVGDKRFVLLGWFLFALVLVLSAVFGFREYRLSRRQIRQLQARLDLKEKMKPIPAPEKDWPRIQSKLEEMWNITDLQMQSLVDQTGIPAHRITAAIKESTGLSFKVLLNQMRLQKAEKMLIETSEQVGQIALQCGYGNVAHFYRVFKQAYGMNPGDFRQKGKI